MKRLFATAAAGLLLAACAREDNTDFTGTASPSETGAAQSEGMAEPAATVPDAGGGETQVIPAPRPAVSANSAQNSGTGTATAQGAVANTPPTPDGMAAGENQNLDGVPPQPPAPGGGQAVTTNNAALENGGANAPGDNTPR